MNEISQTQITGALPRLPTITIVQGKTTEVTIHCPPPHQWIPSISTVEVMLDEHLVKRNTAMVDMINNMGVFFSFVNSCQISNFIACTDYSVLEPVCAMSSKEDVLRQKQAVNDRADAICIRWISALKELTEKLIGYSKKRKISDSIDASW